VTIWSSARSVFRYLAPTRSWTMTCLRSLKTIRAITAIIICTNLAHTAWIHHFGAVARCHTEAWGVVTSLRVHYTESFEVEFGLTTRAWAGLPVDPGTQDVVSHGMRILWDREGLLARLHDGVY